MESHKLRRCSWLSLDSSIFNPGLIWTHPYNLQLGEARRKGKKMIQTWAHLGLHPPPGLFCLRCRPSWRHHHFPESALSGLSTSCNGAPKTLNTFPAAHPGKLILIFMVKGHPWGSEGEPEKDVKVPKANVKFYSRQSSSSSLAKDNKSYRQYCKVISLQLIKINGKEKNNFEGKKSYGQEIIGLNGK